MQERISKRFWLILLPGIGFWVHLCLWILDWSVPSTSSENYWPMLIQIGLMALCVAFALYCLVAAAIKTLKKRTSWHLWLALLVNAAPAVFFYLFIFVTAHPA